MKFGIVLLALAACVAPADVRSTALGTCGDVIDVPLEDGIHVEPPATFTWSTNPPVTGAHYPVWAGYERVYATPVLERGYWLHGVEHGGIALLYACDDGCPEEVSRLVALVRARPRDPHCRPPLRTRILIASDPALPTGTRFAAVAWGSAYRARCLDEPALATFLADHYGRAGENTCDDGMPFDGIPFTLLP